MLTLHLQLQTWRRKRENNYLPHCKFFIELLHSSRHNHPPLLPLAAVAYMRRVFVWLKCCCFIICTLCPAAAAAQSHAIMWVHFTPTQMQPTAPAYTPPPPTPPCCATVLSCLSLSSGGSIAITITIVIVIVVMAVLQLHKLLKLCKICAPPNQKHNPSPFPPPFLPHLCASCPLLSTTI